MGDYAWKYLQQHVKGAQRGLRELLRQGWVESYLKPIGSAQPKLQSAVTLLPTPVTDLTPRQREVLEVLKHRGGDLWLQDLLQTCRTSSSILKVLEKKGCIAIEPRQVLRLERGISQPIDQPRTLSPDQASALTTITTLSGFAQVLLHGVTGSGKTEVYLQAIAPILQRGQSALVLVPEIGLTPQLTDRFRARFGPKVCVYHSALSDGERYDTWRQLLSGTPQVIIGTRSAVFVPLPRLGLIVLDEEHDAGFKQEQSSPCYHARMVAYWRAELENCPLVLGSATPSLESWAAVKQPAASTNCYLCLPERVQARPMPPIEVVDMRQELRQNNRSMFSRTLQAALQNLEAHGEQGLLFVHRRGHSTFVSCRSCGHVVNCPNCDVSLTYHHTQETAQPLLRCHYCNYTRLHPPHCPECSSAYFKYFGSGTQRVMRELTQQFPNLQLIRFDSDTTRTKGAHRVLLERFAQGEANLMVGTQMLTKGIDLPQVKLVGVLAADGLFNLPDYRASERAFQVLTQVAGRAGRGADPGRVIIQTYTPEHPVIQAVQNYDCERFIEAELQQRATLNYPPYGQLILLRLSGPSSDTVKETAQTLAQFLQQQLEQVSFMWELLGPAPANILRVARRYRWQILLKLPRSSEGAVPVFSLPIAQLRSHCSPSVRLTIDVDPVSLLS
jgi:primosomal protein N' (replication factor Y)